MERELHADNQAICSLSPDEVRPFAIRKKPLLLRAILEELGFPASASTPLHKFLLEGFPALGEFPNTGVFRLGSIATQPR